MTAYVLVDDIRELRAGMSVLGVGCVMCGGDHFGRLGKPEPSIWYAGTTAYPIVPQPKCIPAGRTAVIDHGGVNNGRLFALTRVP